MESAGRSLGQMVPFLLIVGLIVWAVMTAKRRRNAPPLFCTSCGTVGPAVTVTRGSFLIEVILWICIVVPGLIYTIWRLTTRHKACQACGAATLIPSTSPVALKMLAAQTPIPRS